MRITEINETSQFLDLQGNWNRLLNRCRDNNPYLTWEFLSTYWKHFGKNKKLRILCIEDEKEIIGIAPLRQSRLSLIGPFGYDIIEPLGSRGLMLEGADYTGLLLTKKETECLQFFFDYLAAHNSWDFIYLLDIPGSSVIPKLLSQMSNIPFKFRVEKGVSCPYMLVPNSIEALMNMLGPRFRKNLRRGLRQLGEFRKVEIKKYDEVGSVEEAMRSFFNLHQKRCKSEGLPGVFANLGIRNFYMDVAKLFSENNWLALYFLTVDDEPVAAHYCFEYNSKMYFVLGGFDPSYSDYGVGNLLCLRIAEKCIERGLEEYDFLKGAETYKFHWTKKYRANIEIRFVNKKLVSSFYDIGIETLKNTLVNKILQKSTRYS